MTGSSCRCCSLHNGASDWSCCASGASGSLETRQSVPLPLPLSPATPLGASCLGDVRARDVHVDDDDDNDNASATTTEMEQMPMHMHRIAPSRAPLVRRAVLGSGAVFCCGNGWGWRFGDVG
jgi:hypothetical protein